MPQALRVLVVEDCEGTAHTLGALIQLGGHEVHLVHDAEQALAQAADYQPDVVFVDVRLPGDVNGYQLAGMLKKLPGFERTLLVALTGSLPPPHEERWRAAGFDLCPPKPVDPEILAHVLSVKRGNGARAGQLDHH